jgi:5-enolpyruvylshikimate-3-phosphate synthase
LSLAEGVDCYDNYRVAISFGVLGCIAPESILNEKLCAGKTWAQEAYQYTFGNFLQIRYLN